jgi:glycosyltransferase involved in cell wall biosynthesis
MNLLIVSHTAHYRNGHGFVGWGPTIREIDYLAKIFDEVIHVAPVHPEPPPNNVLPYESSRVRVRPVPPSGGKSSADKLGILKRAPVYIRTVMEELQRADLVHVRCPANISLITLMVLALRKKPETRWIKYAGNWSPNNPEAWSYTFQRWWLKHGLARGVITVNGQWPGQPDFVRSFFNPCLTEEELNEAQQIASRKELSHPIRLLFVARLEPLKGATKALRVLNLLLQKGIKASLDIVGDGEDRLQLERMVNTLAIVSHVKFHGWLPRPALIPLYAQSHFMVYPTASSEGWPKVLSEAMAYGVVPVSGNVSSIPQYLESFETGKAFDSDDLDSFVNAIETYSNDPARWKKESQNGVVGARQFSYQNYLKAVQEILK